GDSVKIGTAPVPDGDAFVVDRLYAEVLLPFGVFAIGRMGSDWGLGLVANGGDGEDADFAGDNADRVAFVSPIAGHLWIVAFDINAHGPLAHADNAPTFTFAILRWRNPVARDRRRRAGRLTLEYGAFVSHRWQNEDDGLPRGLTATA